MNVLIGTKYSIAKPGNRGRYEGELLLREDQLLSGTHTQIHTHTHSASIRCYQTVLLWTITLYCDTLRCHTTSDITLYHTTLHYTTLHYTTLHYTTNTHYTRSFTGIWRQKNVKIKKNVISFFGADVTSDVGIHVNKGTYARYCRTFVRTFDLIYFFSSSVLYLSISLPV